MPATNIPAPLTDDAILPPEEFDFSVALRFLLTGQAVSARRKSWNADRRISLGAGGLLYVPMVGNFLFWRPDPSDLIATDWMAH